MKGEEEEEIPPACLSPPLLLHFFVVSRPPKEEEEARNRDRECSGRRRKGIRGHTESGEEEKEREWKRPRQTGMSPFPLPLSLLLFPPFSILASVRWGPGAGKIVPPSFSSPSPSLAPGAVDSANLCSFLPPAAPNFSYGTFFTAER